ncbi:DUF418 domain-containing protein [Pendulispora brunnea]|uniref:DUF418 domain-containing protein n=1 Tax=Pendulispora brunnea TaxID=2905690 RepID=A0ABZ2KKR9_9BACT
MIRGVALLGVLLMNIVDGFRLVPTYAPGVAAEEALSPAERLVDDILYIFVADKAMTMFSMLFGVGLAILLERADRQGQGVQLLLRRLLILFAFGLVHAVFLWEGDILMPYAVAGLGALFVIRLSPRLLLALALVLPAVYPLLLWRWPHLFPQGGPSASAHHRQALAVYAHGTYLEVVAFRVPNVFGVHAQFVLLRGFAQILGNFLLGIFLWRNGVLRRLESLGTWHVGLAVGGMVIGAGYAIFRVVLQPARPPSSMPIALVRLGWNMTLQLYAAGYGAALLRALQRPRARAWLIRTFAPVGRMAFSNYLAQSLLFTTAFYGYGAGLLGRVGIVGAVVLGIATYVVQVAASCLWLRRFQYGPCEWLWRALTYGWRPMVTAIRAPGRAS